MGIQIVLILGVTIDTVKTTEFPIIMIIDVVSQISESAQAVIYLFRQDDTLKERLASFPNADFLIEDFRAEAKQVHVLY